MTLRITDITFRDFRSYPSLELADIGHLTILVGPNAIGKTNIVEGIQLLTALTSFRHATIDQLLRHGSESALLTATVRDEHRLLEVSLLLEGRTRRYRLNGKGKRPSDLRGVVPSVTFTPDDLELVKGPMSVRRHALDVLGSQVNANYNVLLRDYEKVVRHKNRLLKEEASGPLLESIDEMLITCGAQLTCYRVALFNRLAPLLKSRYEEIACYRESFEARYAPSWAAAAAGAPSLEASAPGTLPAAAPLAAGDIARDEARDALERALHARRDEERRRRRALVGSHADAIALEVDGMNASLFGSQGQQRSIVLAWKLAEAAVIEELLGTKPVLLLDDVMSELDGARREALVGYIARDVQTFITTANLAYFDHAMLDEAQVIELPLNEHRIK